MRKPLIALLSHGSNAAAELRAALNSRFTLVICGNPAEAIEFLEDKQPLALIADFEGISSGGHFEERLLLEIRRLYPEMPILMATPEQCPEPLERLVACCNIGHLRGRIDADEIIRDLASQMSLEEPAADSDTQPESAAKSDVVLQGITREFETNTLKLKQMLADLEIAARHDVTILMIGETGSGKTFLSRLIHEVSPRCDEPFMTVACGALPAELIESELFGHMKGSFTSAHADKEGKFVAAGQGTILLDEIDVLGPEQQVKLLRVIESGEFEPVGSNRTITSAARLVVASNLDLQPLVEQGRFRPDLYYRLNMLKFEIPPLRERKPDIESLARKFVQQHTKKHNVQVKRIDRSLLEALQFYPWPGNVRELENVLQRAVIYCSDGVLKSEHLPAHILSGTAGPASDPSVNMPANRIDNAQLGQQIAITEREIIEQALFQNNFNRTNTAKHLGISRVTLYNKMKKYGMAKRNS